MKKWYYFFGLMLLMGMAFSLFAEPVVLGQFPAPSPNGQELAFVFQGDIWVASISGGRANRLTVHEAVESNPMWSPDGSQIAFSSDRNGNNDVFVMQADGSDVRQLTFLSVGDDISGWTPDGKSVLFASRRYFAYPSHRLSSLYVVPVTGGNPKIAFSEYAAQGKYSPDGQTIVFTDGRIDRYRKHYHGSGNSNVWKVDLKTEQYTQLTDYNGNDMLPMWAPTGERLYFVSHQSGTANIWEMLTDGSGKKQLTFHEDDGVTWANISRNGEVLTYCRGAEIWVMNIVSGTNEALALEIPGDSKQNTIEWKTYSKDATEMALSPTEKLIASVIHGELFLSKNQEKGVKKAVRLTKTAAREKNIAWAGEDSLLFVSDRNGNDDIFMLVSADRDEENLYRTLKHRTIRLTKSQAEEHSLKVSPDGKKIAFIREQSLWGMNIKGSMPRLLVESWNDPVFNWSPDSKWLAYSKEDDEYNADIFIISANGGEPVNITRHPDYDVAPVWSVDGKKLAFTAKRHNDTFDIWYVWLQEADDKKSNADWENEADQATVKKSAEKKDDVDTDKLVVKIDFDDIHKRLHRLTSLPGEESNVIISPDGKTFVFKSNTDGKIDIWSIQWDQSQLKKLTSGNTNPPALHFSNDGKKVYYLKSGGTFASISPEGKNNKAIPFQAKMEIDLLAERQQMFEESWRILNTNYYDPNFHGADWSAIRKKYSELVAQIGTGPEFYIAIRMMLGELNSSHLGIYPPAAKGGVQTGMLGLKFDDTYAGKGMKIQKVLPKGPCDTPKVKLESGEILTAINSIKLDASMNIAEILNHQVGEAVELTILNENKSRREYVKPISTGAQTMLEYQGWVQEKRDLVDKLSNGKLAYVHIRGMGWTQLEQFEMELFSEAAGREGLLIDVRYNGGGWITDYILTMLQAKPHAITIPRNGGKGYPQGRRPYYAWSKPVASLCNQYSYSNAELFSHAMKVLDLGPVVGQTTPGFMISTGDTQLLDGSGFRIPSRGWYNLDTGLDQEKHGAEPDYIVTEQKGDDAGQKDRQLEKAVSVLLQNIEILK
ncbi:PD40 domain-containing protein [bacterium]|nr:PD40 domain-containing protein [bacterium]